MFNKVMVEMEDTQEGSSEEHLNRVWVTEELGSKREENIVGRSPTHAKIREKDHSQRT